MERGTYVGAQSEPCTKLVSVGARMMRFKVNRSSFAYRETLMNGRSSVDICDSRLRLQIHSLSGRLLSVAGYEGRKNLL